MNTPLTDQESLDSFDHALLGELRREVTSRAEVRRPRTARRRTIAAGGIASVAAATFGIVTLGSPAAAYAVDRDSSGDITITIHKLDDAAGLQQDLADNGIKAHVSYDASSGTTPDGPNKTLRVGEPDPGAAGMGAPGDGPKLVKSFDSQSPQSGASQSGEGTVTNSDGAPPVANACGDFAHLPLTTQMSGGDYVITIPSGSALHHADSELDITTSGDLSQSVAGITVAFTVDGVNCDFGTLSATARPTG